MIPLYTFPPPGADRERGREDAFARTHIAVGGLEDFARQDFWPTLQRYLRKDRRYLVVAAGTGGWALFLHDQGYAVEGTDRSRRVAQAIADYAPDLQVRVAPAADLPYPDASFDGVIAIGSLESIRGEVTKALREWRRVLTDEGALFLEVPLASFFRRSFYLPLKRLQYLLETTAGRVPVFVAYLFTPDELASLTRAAGFAVVECIPHELSGKTEHFALYHDWPFLRASPAERGVRGAADRGYQLNAVGRMVKRACTAVSPWCAASGIFAVARALPR